jgi:hypothetical protein
MIAAERRADRSISRSSIGMSPDAAVRMTSAGAATFTRRGP